MNARENEVIISVKDTGTGIPPDKLETIFERFEKIDQSLTRKYEGSGIGLSIVKALVEIHGGDITAKSEYGNGSEFTIRLPAKVMPSEEIILNPKDKKEKELSLEVVDIELSDIYF